MLTMNNSLLIEIGGPEKVKCGIVVQASSVYSQRKALILQSMLHSAILYLLDVYSPYRAYVSHEGKKRTSGSEWLNIFSCMKLETLSWLVYKFSALVCLKFSACKRDLR